MERLQTIKGYVEQFRDNIGEIKRKWFSEHRTFWGTVIGSERFVYDTTLVRWYGKYLRRKIESGEIESICLVRSGHLGDVVMTEPVAKFLSKFIKNVSLATEVKEANTLFGTYHTIYPYSDLVEGNIKSDAIVRLVYEWSDNTKTHIHGYMESIGFPDTEINDIPVLNNSWPKIVEGKYVLIAPHTSRWEEKKRNWGYEKFVQLKDLIENQFKIKCIILENEYSFSEMFSLVCHCEFIIGNDSGPVVIAQSFNKKSFIIFGATHPKYVKESRPWNHL